MYRGENEYFKRAIKRAYKRYTGERDDKTATIADVAKFFIYKESAFKSQKTIDKLLFYMLI